MRWFLNQIKILFEYRFVNYEKIKKIWKAKYGIYMTFVMLHTVAGSVEDEKSLTLGSTVNGAQDVIYFVLKYMFDINSSFQFTIII